jgi:hypothetical protein
LGPKLALVSLGHVGRRLDRRGEVRELALRLVGPTSRVPELLTKLGQVRLGAAVTLGLPLELRLRLSERLGEGIHLGGEQRKVFGEVPLVHDPGQGF